MSKEDDGRRKEEVCCRSRILVLVALGGTLAASAIIVAFFVILRPARISFSITHISISHKSDVLNFTVAANNTSHERAAVRYRNVFVDLQGSFDEPGTTYIARLRNPEMFPTAYLRGAAPTRINASLGIDLSDVVKNSRVRTLTVLVKVQAKFKIWKARTKWYDIQVSCNCSGVVLPTSSPIPCT